MSNHLSGCCCCCCCRVVWMGQAILIVDDSQRSVTFSWSPPSSSKSPSEDAWMTCLFLPMATTTWLSQLGSSRESWSGATITRAWGDDELVDGDCMTTCNRTLSPPALVVESKLQSQQQPPGRPTDGRRWSFKSRATSMWPHNSVWSGRKLLRVQRKGRKQQNLK